MNDLYETDILEWSEHHAALLRRLAAGKQVTDQVDQANVVEEIESAAKEPLRTLHAHRCKPGDKLA